MPEPSEHPNPSTLDANSLNVIVEHLTRISDQLTSIQQHNARQVGQLGSNASFRHRSGGTRNPSLAPLNSGESLTTRTLTHSDSIKHAANTLVRNDARDDLYQRSRARATRERGRRESDAHSPGMKRQGSHLGDARRMSILGDGYASNKSAERNASRVVPSDGNVSNQKERTSMKLDAVMIAKLEMGKKNRMNAAKRNNRGGGNAWSKLADSVTGGLMFRGKLGSLRNVGSEKNIYGSAKKIKELSLKEKKNERKASIKKLTAEVHKEGVDVGDNLNTNMAKQIRTLMLIERMKKNFKKRRLKRKEEEARAERGPEIMALVEAAEKERLERGDEEDEDEAEENDDEAVVEEGEIEEGKEVEGEDDSTLVDRSGQDDNDIMHDSPAYFFIHLLDSFIQLHNIWYIVYMAFSIQWGGHTQVDTHTGEHTQVVLPEVPLGKIIMETLEFFFITCFLLPRTTRIDHITRLVDVYDNSKKYAFFTHRQRVVILTALTALPNFTLAVVFDHFKMEHQYERYLILLTLCFVSSVAGIFKFVFASFYILVYIDSGYFYKKKGKTFYTRHSASIKIFRYSLILLFVLHIMACTYVIYMKGFVALKYILVEIEDDVGLSQYNATDGTIVPAFTRTGEYIECEREGLDWHVVNLNPPPDKDEINEWWEGNPHALYNSYDRICSDINTDKWFLKEYIQGEGPKDGKEEFFVYKLYAEAFHKIFQLVLGGDSDANNTREFIFNTFMVFFGYIFSALFIGQFSALFATLDSTMIAQMEEQNNVNRFLEYHDVSHDIRMKIQAYFDYLWTSGKSSGIQESMDKIQLSPLLFYELQWELKGSLIYTSVIFKFLEPRTIAAIIEYLVSFIAIPDEDVLVEGTVGKHMSFIAKGKCRVIKCMVGEDDYGVYEYDEQIGELTSGDAFGEIAMIEENTTRTCGIVADTFVELEQLHREHFNVLCEECPDLQKILKQLARERMEKDQQREEDAFAMIEEGADERGGGTLGVESGGDGGGYGDGGSGVGVGGGDGDSGSPLPSSRFTNSEVLPKGVSPKGVSPKGARRKTAARKTHTTRQTSDAKERLARDAHKEFLKIQEGTGSERKDRNTGGGKLNEKRLADNS